MSIVFRVASEVITSAATHQCELLAVQHAVLVDVREVPHAAEHVHGQLGVEQHRLHFVARQLAVDRLHAAEDLSVLRQLGRRYRPVTASRGDKVCSWHLNWALKYNTLHV